MSGAFGSLISRRLFRTYSSELARLETALGCDQWLLKYVGLPLLPRRRSTRVSLARTTVSTIRTA